MNKHPPGSGSDGDLVGLAGEAAERLRELKALRDSESRYRALTELNPDATLVLVEHVIAYANPSAAHLLGAGKPEALLGRAVFDLIEPEYHEAVREYERRLLAHSGPALLLRTRVRRLDGALIDVEGAAQPIPWQDRPASHVILRDITARRRREAQLALLAGIAEDFSRISCADALMQSVGARIGAHLAVTSCNVAEVDEPRGTVTVHCGWRAARTPDLHRTYRITDYFSEEFRRAGRAGETIVIRDTQTDPRTGARSYAALGIHSFVAVPFHAQGEWKHLLSMTDSRPRDWREDEIELFREISNRLFPRVERIRAEAALRASEARYRALFESMDEGLCILQLIVDAENRPADYRYLEINPAFERQTGLKDVLGRTVREVIPDVEPFWIEVYGRVALTGEPTRFVDHAASLGRWFDVNAFRIGEPHERKVAVLFSDISARKQAEEGLRESEARHAFLVRLGDALRALADPVEIQSAASRLLGEHLGAGRAYYYEYDEEAGCGVVRRDYVRDGGASLAGSYRIEDFSSSHGALREGRPLVFADAPASPRLTPAERAGYEALGLRAHLCVPHARNGRLLAVLAVSESAAREWTPLEVALVRDTAERTWAAVERARAESALRAADGRKDDFLATLAHELRNPLAPVRTGLRILRLSPPGAPAVPRSLDMMERQVSHMVRLIDDLLDVSRISRGRIALKRERLTLRSVLDSAIETSRPFIDAGRHELTLQMRHEPLHLDADPIRLAQVLSNLLNNAAKYTSDAGRIELSSQREGDEAVIRVKDNGVGIAREMLPRVFERFAQAGSALDRAQGGLGIGLSIVKHLVGMHQGTIHAESPGPGLGAVFTVRLPLAPDPPGKAPVADAGAQAPKASARRVLVVDDNVDAAESLTTVLALLGHDIRAAHSGAEALGAAADFRPSIVFCDIGMPGMDGYEVARRLRKDPGAPPALLVALTGWGSEDDKRRALEAGFDFHLTKPVDITAVQELLALHGEPGHGVQGTGSGARA